MEGTNHTHKKNEQGQKLEKKQQQQQQLPKTGQNNKTEEKTLTTLLAMALTSSEGPTRSEVPESRMALFTVVTDSPETVTSSMSICQYPFLVTGT